MNETDRDLYILYGMLIGVGMILFMLVIISFSYETFNNRTITEVCRYITNNDTAEYYTYNPFEELTFKCKSGDKIYIIDAREKIQPKNYTKIKLN